MTERSSTSGTPDSLDDVPAVVEFGGAIGRTASTACKQAQHDLCADDTCMCRCHCRVPGDVPMGSTAGTEADRDQVYPCRFCPDTVAFDNCWRHTSDQSIILTVWIGMDCDTHRATPDCEGR